GNKYFVMRHGEAESNVKDSMHGVVSSREDGVDHLTKNGKEQVLSAVEKLKDKKFDVILVSPLMRTRETFAVLKENLDFKDTQIIFEKRLGELRAGDFEGKPWDEYHKMFKDERTRFLNPIDHGESVMDVKKRVGDFLYELEEKYENKNILIISHGSPLWMLYAVASGYDVDESINMTGGLFRHSEMLEKKVDSEFKHFSNAEVRTLEFISLPHNENYELDLHKPYIDVISLVCTHSTGSGQACSGRLMRTREVMDVWFDSGAMPFAQDHYPFENKGWVDGVGYPADFICEAIDQTRGWFYTLHAVGVLMGRGKAYKNVICLGHLLDATGKKMSKSLGNIVDPWIMMDKYGVDTLRLWMYSVNQPGESKNFDEKTVALLHQQVFGLFYNVLAFYELYRDKNLELDDEPKSKNVLDIWILARLDELIQLTTESLDSYKLLEGVRGMREFIGDLSTWYLRRSRERIKEGDKDAKQTLYFVLKTLAKIMAPFAPFTAEDVWLKLKNENDLESVHLEKWPAKKFRFISFMKPKVLDYMETVRNIVTFGLEARQKAGIKVRQPLSKLEIIAEELSDEYLEIIKNELNVKEVVYVLKTKIGITKVNLDTDISIELKQEGDYRELARALQDMRKKLGLTPNEVVSLVVEANEKGKELIQKFESDLKKIVSINQIKFENNNGEEIKIDELLFKVKIDK
ncbi:MAG: class I tRNA ligase family protein, partial [Candidatus Parcubacteria bacterium]|nr:class I tRNA ligase family protein [Candidatus Parcubacteria bacterium]